MLALKGIDYEYVAVPLREGGQHTDAFGARSPMNQVPVLEWSAPEGERRLTQSLAIARYLDAAHPEPPLVPREALAGAVAWELAEIVNAGTQPLQNFDTLQRVKALGGDPRAWARVSIAKGLAALEARARETAGEFLVGDTLSLADLLLVPQLYNARRFGVELAPLPTLVAIEARCEARPEFVRAHPRAQPDAEDDAPA